MAQRTYPVCGAEVDGLSKVVALIEAAVIGSREGDDKLSRALIGPVHLYDNETGQSPLTVDKPSVGQNCGEVTQIVSGR